MDKIDWCCRGLEHYFNSAGERGFGVVVKVDADGVALFLIQARAVDKNVDPTQLIVKETRVPISLISELAIRFCPWCGRDLGKAYRQPASLHRPGFAITD